MSNANTSLSAARKAKNDEFYTRIEDVEREMRHYEKHFEGKTVFLNCDDPSESNFWRYFELNFDRLGLRRLISTHYDPEKPTYMQEIVRGDDLDGDGKHTGLDIRRRDLLGNGDFRSPEAMALLDESDIVVTNPPFSLFREYIAQLVEHNKDFIVIGNMNAITYKEVWQYIQAGRVWLGSMPSFMAFRVPDDSEPRATRYWEDEEGKWRSLGNACWFTTLDHARRHEEIPLFRRYEDDPSAYPKYANYDAIEVSKVADIPADYTVEREVTEDELSDITSRGFVVTVLDRPTDRPDSRSVRIENPCMGVPITFLGKHNPEQFEIVGYFVDGTEAERMGARRVPVLKAGKPSMSNGPVIGTQKLYDRILIRRVISSSESRIRAWASRSPSSASTTPSSSRSSGSPA